MVEQLMNKTMEELRKENESLNKQVAKDLYKNINLSKKKKS